MKPQSLRIRLMVYAAIAISLALGAAGLATYLQFKKHANDLILQQLDEHFVELLGYLEIDAKGNPVLTANLSDPRFNHPYSGLYWQVDMAGKESGRSRSLWEERLNVVSPPQEEEDDHVHTLSGPNGVELIGLERLVKLPQDDGSEPRAIVTIALDAAAVNKVQGSFLNRLLLGFGVLYLALLLGSFAQIMLGLRPLQALRRSLEEVRSGRAPALEGKYPGELTPLVGELNGLLNAREHQLQRARQRASNLAHGLKTPLTVMKTLAQNLRLAGQREVSIEINDNANIMSQLVERELARARASNDNHTAHVPLRSAVDKIVKTMRHVADQGIEFQNQVPNDFTIPMENGDLLELLGNLADNSRRYAYSVVRVSIAPGRLIIDDDGPGVPPDKMPHIIRRGGRLDEKSGTGLGLAIVSDLADSYAFNLQLSDSPLGGLRVTLIWADETGAAHATPPAQLGFSSFDDGPALINGGGAKLLLNAK